MTYKRDVDAEQYSGPSTTVRTPCGEVPLHDSDWVVKDDRGYWVYLDGEFQRHFRRAV